MERESRKLPELLTKAELCIEDITKANRIKKDSDNDDNVVNPPPTPETDAQTSGDSMDHLNVLDSSQSVSTRKIEKYEDDFLDINVDNNMDMF